MEIIGVELALNKFILDKILFVYEVTFIWSIAKHEPVWIGYRPYFQQQEEC